MREIPANTLFGIRFNPITKKETIDLVLNAIHHKKKLTHCVINVAKLVHAQKDSLLKKSINQCDIINIDGMGVVLGAKLLGISIPERVTGIDLMIGLLSAAEKKKLQVYILGAKPDVLKKALENVSENFPKLSISGHHGYFQGNENDVIYDIQSKRPDILFVAISSPYKEIFIQQYEKVLNIPFTMGVGGSVDVIAGLVKRAPHWMQKIGLEWLYRFIQEPQRMWRRYLITNSLFIWMLAKEKLCG